MDTEIKSVPTENEIDTQTNHSLDWNDTIKPSDLNNQDPMPEEPHIDDDELLAIAEAEEAKLSEEEINAEIVADTNEDDVVNVDSKKPAEEVKAETEAKPKRGRKKNTEAQKADSGISERSEAPESRSSVLAETANRNAQREKRSQERAKFLASWSGLNTAMKRKTIMEGTISEVVMMPMKETAEQMLKTSVFVVVFTPDMFRVMIPFHELYRDFPIDMKSVDLSTEKGANEFIRRQRSMAEKLYGLTIPYIIDNMILEDHASPESDYAISGSRKKALEIQEKANYDAASKDAEPRYKAGDIVNARVTSVSNWSIQANVGGIDTSIRVYDLTYDYISKTTDISKKFKVNDVIQVEIQEIKTRPDGKHTLRVSAKTTELEAAKNSAMKLRPGTNTYATVINIRQSRKNPSRIIISLYMDAHKRPAFCTEFAPSRNGFYPQPGDKVAVTVKDVNDNGMVHVACRRILGSTDIFTR